MPRATTPTLDTLAARGVRFETAVAHAPLTGPVARVDPDRPDAARPRLPEQLRFMLPPRVRTVAEDFRKAGYRTAAFVSGLPARSAFRLRSRLRVYDDHLPRGNDPAPDAVRRAQRGRDDRRRAEVARPRRPAASAAPGSSGSTTTILTRRTSRRRNSRERFRQRRTTARSRSWIAQLGRLLEGSPRGDPIARSCSSPRTTARASASTARAPTASSSTTRRCACPGSWRVPASL